MGKPFVTGLDRELMCLLALVLGNIMVSEGALDSGSESGNDIPLVPVQPFSCPFPNGVYPDPLECANFYICVNNQGTKIQCLPGFGFDTLKGYCSPKGQVPACAVSNILDGLKCPSDGFQPDKLDCSQFYWCYSGSAIHVTCPMGMHFDKNSKICLHPDMAKCSSILDP